ncbi:MAG: arginine--tRNA ligase, partial [Candidatus Methanomethylicus sp.]|nr:arginine--tRNA ligase [Candidatus Methanomethylicus sp.]
MENSPFILFKSECEALLERALSDEGIQTSAEERRLATPSDPNLGDLSFSTFNLSKKAKADPRSIATKLAARAGASARELVDRVEAAGGGYVNFHINAAKFSQITLSAIAKAGSEYGMATADGEGIMVEHTSVNPIHPIHIGGARNAIIGDCLSRILRASGANVKRHFYIDDVGLQVAQASYGFSKLGAENSSFVGGK